MIIETIINGLKNIIFWFIEFLPQITISDSLAGAITGLNDSIEIIYYFVTPTIGILLISTVLFWLVVQPTASLIKFIYRKVPGVS